MAEPAPFTTWSLPPGAAEPSRESELPPARTRAGEAPDLTLRTAAPAAAEIGRHMESLRGSRESLLARPASEVAAALGAVAGRFLDGSDPLREEALALLPGSTGLSEAMCRRVLDGMARDWTADRLRRLVELEFPSGELDAFVDTGRDGRRVRALGPAVAFHVAAGTVPGVSLTSLLRSLLVKTPVLLKPGRGDVVLPVLFHRALLRSDPALAAAAAVVYWPGGAGASAAAEEEALSRAGLVVAYGGASTVEDLRCRLPAATPLVAYHHRISVAVVGSQGTTPGEVDAVGRRLADAVATFDQRGCVSPRVVFAVGCGPEGRRRLAAATARALAELGSRLPPGRIDDAQASAVRQARDTDALRQAAGEVEVWGGQEERWSVVLDPGASLEPSCLDRTVRVVPAEDTGDVVRRLSPLGRYLQTVGHAGFGAEELDDLAERLARAGAMRLAPLEEVAFPPPWWLHDGEGPLEALVRRVELARR